MIEKRPDEDVEKEKEANELMGKKIREAREAKSMSEAQLAEKLRVTLDDLHNYESGAKRLPAVYIFELAKILGVEVKYFMGGEPPEPEKGTVH